MTQVVARREHEFSGTRLRTARLFRSMTQAALAELSGVVVSHVSQMEGGLRRPGGGIAEALAAALNFDVEFFYGDPLDEYRSEECNFRSPKTTPEKLKAQALSYGTLLNLLIQHVEKNFELEPQNVPEFRVASPEDIEVAAEICRREWELGIDTPIDNAVRAVESLGGIIVARLPHETERVDAFSRHGTHCTMVLNTERGCASRWRFDVGHELGHLVMHPGLETGDEEHEAQADRFASAWLLPRAGFSREFPRGSYIPLDALVRLKRRWKSSAQSMVRRALDLKLIDAAHHQRLYKAMSAAGWMRNEPEEPDVEEPESLASALDAWEEDEGVTVRDIARDLRIPIDAIERLTGRKAPPEPEPPPGTERPPAPVIPLRGQLKMFDR